MSNLEIILSSITIKYAAIALFLFLNRQAMRQQGINFRIAFRQLFFPFSDRQKFSHKLPLTKKIIYADVVGNLLVVLTVVYATAMS